MGLVVGLLDDGGWRYKYSTVQYLVQHTVIEYSTPVLPYCLFKEVVRTYCKINKIS